MILTIITMPPVGKGNSKLLNMVITDKSANNSDLSFAGGCSPQARPAAVRQCTPACRKPFSYCTQVSHMLGCPTGIIISVLFLCSVVCASASVRQSFYMLIPPSRGIWRDNNYCQDCSLRNLPLNCLIYAPSTNSYFS